MLTVSPCPTVKNHRLFETIPENLHGGESAFVPPAPGDVVKYLAPNSAFHRRHGEIIPLIAYRSGRAVGRIAAIVNRTHNQLYNDRTGFFGFFACENHSETARELFAAAEKILRDRGLTTVRGPYNPSINDECGLLVHGHEHPPSIGLTWNPAYYEKLVKECGFTVARELFGFLLPLHRLDPPPRLEKIIARVARRNRVRLRPIHLDQLEKELKIVHEVYNSSLERNWGFVPITLDDLLSAADDLRAIADPEMIQIAELDGENAGVGLSLPNINELLILTKRTPRWLRLLHLFWLIKTRRIRSGRQVIYGISPRYRDRGIHGWLLYQQFVSAKERFTNAELGWIESNNIEILENSRMLGAEPLRKWQIVEKLLA